MFVGKIWRALFSCNTRFEIHSFALFSTESRHQQGPWSKVALASYSLTMNSYPPVPKCSNSCLIIGNFEISRLAVSNLAVQSHNVSAIYTDRKYPHSIMVNLEFTNLIFYSIYPRTILRVYFKQTAKIKNLSQLVFTCSKLTRQSPEKYVKSAQR